MALRALAVAAVLFVLTAPASAGDLTERLADYRGLGLDGQGVAAAGQTLALGHLRLQFESGTLVPIKSRGGEPLGFYFEGFGRYEYESQDAADLQVIEGNCREATKAPICNGAKIKDTLKRMLVFAARPVFEEAWSAATSPIEPDEARGFEAIWKRIGKTYLEYDHLAAEARLNAGEGQYVFAEIEGTQETVGYSFDRVRAFEERFFLFRKFAEYDLRFQRRVSAQLIDGGAAEQPALAVLTAASFDVSTEDNRVVRITSDLAFRMGVDGLTALPLSLVNHADPYVYDWQAKRNVLNVQRVVDESGAERAFSHRYHEILVELPAPSKRGETVRLRFETEGDILTTMSGDRGDNYFELFSVAWYPQPFGWNTSAFALDLRFRTRKPFLPIASGKTKSLRDEGDFWVLEAASEQPVKLIALFAGRYKVEERKFGDRTVRVYAYASANKSLMEKLPELAEQFIKVYEGLLGPYPFDELSVVEVPTYGFGIAPSGMVLLTSEAYRPREDYLASYFSHGINNRLSHEIAHQWFGHVVTPATPRDTWLSESFAEYMSGIAMAAGQKSSRVAGFDQMLTDWWTGAEDSKSAGPLTAASMLGGDTARANRFRLLYRRGPLVLRMLHTTVGNDRFFEILRTFLAAGKSGAVTTDDFRKACEKVLRTDMHWLIDHWVEQGGIPEVTVDHQVRSGPSGPVLAGRASMRPGSAHKRMIIPIAVEYGGDAPRVFAVDLDAPSKEFEFPLPGRPTKIKVDPSRAVLARFD